MKSREIKPYTRQVYYYETDKMGIVHHSNYIRWLEEARVHMLSEINYPFELIEQQGIEIPVLAVNCEYKYPLTFGDIFEIQPIVTFFNGCRVIFEYKVINKTAGKISALCKTEHCFTNMKMRPIRIQKAYSEVYDMIVDSVDKFE